MNEVHARIIIRDQETGETIAELGEASHVIADPGQDVQSVHGWRNYVAERMALAVKATVAGALTREIALESVPLFTAEEIQVVADALTAEATPEIVFDLLLLVAEEIPREDMPTLDEIRGWTPATREEVATWAASIHGAASDNPVTIPATPAVLEGDDDDAKDARDDAGGEAPEDGAAGAPAGGGEAGAAGADRPGADGAGAGPEAGDPPADPGEGGEAHAGSGGAAAGGEGAGAVSRPRAGRRRSSEEAAAEARRRDGAKE